MTLGEVPRLELPAVGPEEVRAGHVEQQRGGPQRLARAARRERARNEEPTAHRRAPGQPDHRVPERLLVPARHHEQEDVRDPDHRERDREGERVVAEGLRRGERSDEERGHRREQEEADRALLGIDDAGQPGVPDPRPPEQAEQQERLADALPRRMTDHDRRALRDREHEDQVEEELEGRDLLAVAPNGTEPGRTIGMLSHGPGIVARGSPAWTKAVERTYAALMSDDLASPEPLSVQSYLSVLWRRKWIIFFVTVLVFGVGLARSLSEEKVYRAQGTVVLENAQDADVQTQMRLIETPVVRDLANRRAPGVGGVQTRQDGLGNVISVSADANDPVQASRTVNATLAAYLEYSQQRAQQQSATATAAIQARINTLQGRIDALSGQIAASTTPGTDLVARRDALIAQQSSLQERLDTLQIDAATAGSSVAVVGRATPPSEPITPKPLADGLIALGAGLLLGVAIAFLVEYLSGSTQKSHRLAAQVGTDVTLMGVIPTAGTLNPQVVSISAPESQSAEAYRSLSGAASAMGLARGRCIEITSAPGPEGKTETLANLAVLLARSGHRVIVVDADLRDPQVHEYFGVSNEIGLTTVLLGEGTLSDAIQRVPAVDHLFVLTSGPVPMNPTELLASARCSEVLSSLQAGGTLVLVDTPPALPDTDAAVLAQSAPIDAVVLVGTAKAHSKRHLREALELMQSTGVPQVGVVLTTEDLQATADSVSGRQKRRERKAEARAQASSSSERDTTLPGGRDDAGSSGGTSPGQVIGGTVFPKPSDTRPQPAINPAPESIDLTETDTIDTPSTEPSRP